MLLNSGTTSLIGYTRLLLSDLSTAAKPMFTDAQYKSALNAEYLLLREDARFVGQGSGLATAYDDAVESQVLYDLPARFVRMRSVLLDTAGANLSTAPTSTTAVVLEPRDFPQADEAWQSGVLTTNAFYAIKDRSLAILAPPAAAAVGTNSIQMIYEANGTELVNDTDEPKISRAHHVLICLRAANTLLASKHQENQVLLLREGTEQRKFERAATDEAWSPDQQAAVAGLDDQTDWSQNTGFSE